MSKAAGPNENYRVTVTPDVRYMLHRRTGESKEQHAARIQEHQSDECNTIASAIKRHVDNFGSVYVEYDRTEVCSHCGSVWTEGKDLYNGGCCGKDIAEEDERIANAAAQGA